MDSRQCLHWAPYSYWGFTHAAQKTWVILEALQPELLSLCPGRSFASSATAQESPVETLANWVHHLVRVTHGCKICPGTSAIWFLPQNWSHLLSSIHFGTDHLSQSAEISTSSSQLGERPQHRWQVGQLRLPQPNAVWLPKTRSISCASRSGQPCKALMLVLSHGCCIYFTLAGMAKQLSLFHWYMPVGRFASETGTSESL